MARATGSTMFVVAAAAFECLLAFRGGRTDVVLSTTLSGRGRPELDGLISMFSGIGRIQTDLSGEPTFVQAVRRTRHFVFGYEHQDVPFMRVRTELFPDFPAAGPALAAALPVELQYFRTAGARRAPGTGVVEGGSDGERQPGLFFRGQLHPLSLTVLDDGQALRRGFSFKLDFYVEGTIEGLARGLEAILAAGAGGPVLSPSAMTAVAAVQGSPAPLRRLEGEHLLEATCEVRGGRQGSVQ